jgi:hypothetical protein
MSKSSYSIEVEGYVDVAWSQWFSGWKMSHPGTDKTILQSGYIDQTALHGVIQKIRDLNLEIISIFSSRKNPKGKE